MHPHCRFAQHRSPSPLQLWPRPVTDEYRLKTIESFVDHFTSRFRLNHARLGTRGPGRSAPREGHAVVKERREALITRASRSRRREANALSKRPLRPTVPLARGLAKGTPSRRVPRQNRRDKRDRRQPPGRRRRENASSDMPRKGPEEREGSGEPNRKAAPYLLEGLGCTTAVALQHDENRCQIADQAPAFRPSEFGHVTVLFLGQHRRPGREVVAQ